MNKETSGYARHRQLEDLCGGSLERWYFGEVTIAANLKRLRTDRKLSQPKLAAMAGVSQQLISQLENGANGSTKALPMLAKALEVPVTEIDPRFELEPPADDAERKTVSVVGYVSAGAAHYFGSSDDEVDRVPAPNNATDHTVGVEVRGESLGSFFDRWIIFYDEVRSPITNDLVGKLCVVGLPDDRVLVKRVRRSKNAGFYHLESATEGTIYDVEIVWAALVTNMAPQ